MVAAWPRQDVCFLGPLPAAPAANAISPTKAEARASTVSLRMFLTPFALSGWVYPEDDAGSAILRPTTKRLWGRAPARRKMRHRRRCADRELVRAPGYRLATGSSAGRVRADSISAALNSSQGARKH